MIAKQAPMKYSTEITIDLPRKKVVELFDCTGNLFKWEEGLISHDPLDGEPGQEGALSVLVYEGRRGELRMIETIKKRNLPDEFHRIYETRGVYHMMYNYFSESGNNRTVWKTVSVFRFRGLTALMAPFMIQAFRGNTLLNMERFKAFAESAEMP
jgi:hypothetical protein